MDVFRQLHLSLMFVGKPTTLRPQIRQKVNVFKLFGNSNCQYYFICLIYKTH